MTQLVDITINKGIEVLLNWLHWQFTYLLFPSISTDYIVSLRARASSVRKLRRGADKRLARMTNKITKHRCIVSNISIYYKRYFDTGVIRHFKTPHTIFGDSKNPTIQLKVYIYRNVLFKPESTSMTPWVHVFHLIILNFTNSRLLPFLSWIRR